MTYGDHPKPGGRRFRFRPYLGPMPPRTVGNAWTGMDRSRPFRSAKPPPSRTFRRTRLVQRLRRVPGSCSYPPPTAAVPRTRNLIASPLHHLPYLEARRQVDQVKSHVLDRLLVTTESTSEERIGDGFSQFLFRDWNIGHEHSCSSLARMGAEHGGYSDDRERDSGTMPNAIPG